MYVFLIEDEELFEKYSKIWNKVRNSIKKELDSEPLYNENYLRTIVKYHEAKINTGFHDNEIPEEGSNCIFFSNIN